MPARLENGGSVLQSWERLTRLACGGLPPLGVRGRRLETASPHLHCRCGFDELTTTRVSPRRSASSATSAYLQIPERSSRDDEPFDQRLCLGGAGVADDDDVLRLKLHGRKEKRVQLRSDPRRDILVPLLRLGAFVGERHGDDAIVALAAAPLAIVLLDLDDTDGA